MKPEVSFCVYHGSLLVSTLKPDTHWIGGWECPRAGLDKVEGRKFWQYRDSNSDPSVFQPVAIRYTDYAIPVLVSDVIKL
jgi:hypothetical protein